MDGKLAIFEKLANVFRVPDLRKRVLFTLAMLAVYRLGSHIPTPGVNAERLKQIIEQSGGGLLNFYDLFSGGNLKRFTIFALGIMPYITSSIILQLLTVVYEPLARLQKEGELGRRKITQWTRYLTFALAVVAFIVFMERSERRIPVQYAKRVVGRRVMGGQSTHLPLRVNSGGVMPVIFASSLLSIPQMLTQVSAFKTGGSMHRYFGPLLDQLRWGEPLYTLLYAMGIIFFAYFYVSIVFNPSDVADNMRKYGGFIPGIRPGHRTRDYINEVLTRVTLVGGLYLILISLIPEWMIAGIHLNHLPWWLGGTLFERLPSAILNGLGVNFYFGGTSLLIVVGVAMDTVNQIESQLVMRHYEGFTSKKGLIKGRKIGR